MKNKMKITASMLAFVALLVVTTGVTLAYFSYKGVGKTENTISVGGITFHYKEINGKGHGISITDALPVASNEDAKSSDKYFDFKITSTTMDGVTIPYIVTARMDNGSDSILGNIIDIYLTEVNGTETPTALFAGEYVKYNELEDYEHRGSYTEKVIYTDTVSSASYEKNFRLRMWIDQNTNLNTGNGQSNYNNKTFSITVNVNAEGQTNSSNNSEPNDPIDPTNPANANKLNAMILNDYEVITTAPTLTTTSELANENGLYRVAVNGQGYGGRATGGNTYVFRGDVDNVVEFAGETWRIVRINEDGTVRLIIDSYAEVYNGIVPFGNDDSKLSNMYYSTSDNVKDIVDDWYESLIVDGGYDSYVASGNYFCEAANVTWNKPDESPYSASAAVLTPYDSYTPTLQCITDNNDHGLYSGKAAFLSYDEAVFAGLYPAEDNKNSSTYFYHFNRVYNWWLMTPIGMAGNQYASVWRVRQDGELEDNAVSVSFALKPVINLKADTTATKEAGTGYYVVD